MLYQITDFYGFKITHTHIYIFKSISTVYVSKLRKINLLNERLT